MRRTLLAFLLLSLSSLACAQVYKWTDAQGLVHYTDSPPPNGTTYKNVKTTGTVEAPVPTPAPAPASAPATANTAGTAKDSPENRSKLCSQLQTNIDLLGKDAPLTVDDANGARVTIDADRRQQELETARAQHKQYCGS
jgi:hypothetical protein